MNKKILLSISIIIIIINALLPHYVSASNGVNTKTTTTTTGSATNTGSNTSTSSSTKMDSLQGQNTRKEIVKQSNLDVERAERTVSMDDKSKVITGVGNSKGNEGGVEANNGISAIVKAVFKILYAFPYGVQFLMTIVTIGDNETVSDGRTSNGDVDMSKMNLFTIKRAVLGKVPIFDVNFYNTNTSGSKASSELKKSVLEWYNVMYRLAQVISLLTLIYVGIRMVISSTAADEVKYKVMLKNWLMAFAILCALPYIIVFVLRVNELLVSLIPASLLEKGYEEQIVQRSINIMKPGESVWTALIYFITYVIMVGYEVYFFLKYFKRVLTIGFLIIIAPLITITYPIDKIGDNQAQAYSSWMKLFIGNVFMQALQALLYGVFVFSAAAIADKAPMIALIFFIGIIKGEEVLKKLFRLAD